LKVRVLTVFPGLVESALAEGMVRIARERGALDLKALDLRDFTDDPHRTTDDAPYGGGAGMVMKVDPVVRAWRSLDPAERGRAFVLSARGRRFDQQTAHAWSEMEALTLVCGRYQGLDERVLDLLPAEEISLGDFVLAGGELAAAVMVDATARLLPGVLGDVGSRIEDSYEDGLLGFPVYTRPEEFEGRPVPEVLLSGHHGRIAQWRREQRLITTWLRRPDLLETARLSREDREFLRKCEQGSPGMQGSEASEHERNREGES
jgi:tRNA (guanine37-N1)-methyltransferase